MGNKVTVKTALLIAGFEGGSLKAYKDVVDRWTWGIGITRATGFDVLQYKNKESSVMEVARVFIDVLEKKYAPAVRKVFLGYKLTEEQFAAALSFHYNTGAIAKASWIKAFKEGNMKEARRRFMLYKKPKQVIPRRRKECVLFFDGEWPTLGRVPFYTVNTNYRINWKVVKRIDMTAVFEHLLGKKKVVKKIPWWRRWFNV